MSMTIFVDFRLSIVECRLSILIADYADFADFLNHEGTEGTRRFLDTDSFDKLRTGHTD